MVGATPVGYVHEGIEHIQPHDTTDGPCATLHHLSPDVTPHLRTLYVRQRAKDRLGRDVLHVGELETEAKQLHLNKSLALRADSLLELHLIVKYTLSRWFWEATYLSSVATGLRS